MIYELVPQYVEKYMNEHKEKMVLDIQTLVNGKMVNSNNITDAIKEVLAKELNK